MMVVLLPEGKRENIKKKEKKRTEKRVGKK